MTGAEKLQRAIEGKLESIRLDWIEMAAALSPAEWAEIRRSTELRLADLKDELARGGAFPRATAKRSTDEGEARSAESTRH